MDHCKWSKGVINNTVYEENVYDQNAITIYNQEDLTGFKTGRLQLTSHRLIWHAPSDPNCKVETDLSQIVKAELKQVHREGESRYNRTYLSRLIVSFDPKEQNFNGLSIIDKSLSRSFTNPFVQFEFEYGGHKEFNDQLHQQLDRKRWTNISSGHSSTLNIGITGIQRNIQTRLDQQDKKINNSFKDLSVLMNQAKEMVKLSNNITAKLAKEKASSENDDEDMDKLKGYFSNMGIIDSPVTKETSGSKYFKDLAKEISKNLTDVIAAHGGIMTLSDVFCRLNRARAIAGLISAEDLLNSCKQLNKLNEKLKYNIYIDLNLHVLEINSIHNDKINEISEIVNANESVTPYGLSKIIGCSLIVAKKHLLDGEQMGKLCRDDTGFGLKFYSNLFLL